MHDDKTAMADAPWVAQLRKGLLEFAVLALLQHKEAYGYELLKRLDRYPALSVKESTLYLLLGRLKKEGVIAQRLKPSDSGPPRRYFHLTALGKARLEDMGIYWIALQNALNQMIEGESTP
ncbi:MAG: PadR family transcriptional regulator [Robiginitomaculum sp.]|nr:PadR family transcriptional regulator [Robiginitomaculum sp.]MDQ7078071.1 PadR family transcriptional regulator [Robiginitomaculum sp.]